MAEQSEENDVGIIRDGVTVSYWRTARLWQLSETLPVEHIPLAELVHLSGLDDSQTLTNRALGLKARRIMEANLDHPIILSAEGWMWDGWHRLMKAFALGLSDIKAVPFPVDPEPDYVKSQENPASGT